LVNKKRALKLKDIKKPENNFRLFCGESRIRTCEVCTADLQSALVGRLSISPTLKTPNPLLKPDANIGTFSMFTNIFLI
jgi:hypothetical protein